MSPAQPQRSSAWQGCAPARNVFATWTFFALLTGSVMGTAAQLRQGALWPAVHYVGLIGVAAVLLAGVWSASARGFKLSESPVDPRRMPWALLCCVMAAGACLGAAQTGLRARHYQSQALAPEMEGVDVRVSGVVANMPQPFDTGVRFQFSIEAAHWADDLEDSASHAAPQLPPRVSLTWYATARGDADVDASDGQRRTTSPAQHLPSGSGARTGVPAVHAGERWSFTVRFKAPHGHRNPHGFDYELWMWEQGVQATGYVRMGSGAAAPQRLDRAWRYPVQRARAAVRDAILARAAESGADIDAPSVEQRRRAYGVVAALVTGDQAAIDRNDWSVFRATGVAHLMSISGLHITLFAWLASALVRWCWRRSTRLLLVCPASQAAWIGGVTLAATYALFSGWGVPAQRTVGMLLIVSVLRAGARHWPWPYVWLTVCAIVVACDPWALLQGGFWLSFVAVGVLFASDAGLAQRLHDAQLRPARRWLAQGWRLLREQWVVTLALTPLSLLLFHQVSGVGFAANLLAIPWVTLVVTPLAMLGVLIPSLWDLAASAVAVLAVVLAWFAAWPFATWSVAAAPLWAGAAGVLGGLLLVVRLPLAWRALGLALLVPVLLWQAPRPASGQFDLLAVDVGQGTAVLLRTAQHSLVYDAGPRYGPHSDAGERVLLPLLRALGERPQLLVLSHRDADHTGGAPALLKAYPRMKLLSSMEAAHPLQQIRPGQRCEAGQHWHWDGVQFEVLHPAAPDYARLGIRPNALSCVLRISNGLTAVLLTGDLERAQENALVASREGDGAPLQADLMLVPHHGSKTSSSEALLDAVAPRWALVQAAWRNRFGHPAAEVTARYRQRGIGLVDSSHCGAAWWQSVQPTQLWCERLHAPRYWQHSPPPAP